MSKVVIAGGGVIGLCSAYYLLKEGHDVTVIDRGDITDGTSFGNAGYVSPSHFIPLATPGIIAKGLRWMLSSSSPFYIKPRLNADLIKWGMNFWKSSNKETVERHIPPMNAILQLSRRLQSEIKEDIGNSFRMEEIGCFMLYKQAATEKHEIEMAEQAAELGIETKILSAAEVQAMEPDVEVNVRGGIIYPIDCHLHPGDFMRSMKNYLHNRGVKFQLNSTITGFEKSGGKISAVVTSQGTIAGDEFILAAGSWMPLITRMLGVELIMQAGKGYSMTFKSMKKNLRYPAILVDDRVAMTPMGADLRMGGTMEISGLDSPMLIKRAQAIFKASRNYYPGLEVNFPSTDQIWSGLRPLSPDGLPYIGRAGKYKNLVIAGGHAMLGLSLAAATGKIAEELIGQRKTSIDISAFDVHRFA
ncbi:NAD(P)/FAD-dependent oxidoreductase [Pollutibacter soli]|uniref:NAD(P)/FAD-dependent oxidoreductase n=1 Tax=Pollutibacter soli TaxID=3034157 RepID=UPI003013386D